MSIEAETMADLIEPFQISLIRDFCNRLATSPERETTTLFGEGVSFYCLSQRSADALTVALANRVRESRQR